MSDLTEIMPSVHNVTSTMMSANETSVCDSHMEEGMEVLYPNLLQFSISYANIHGYIAAVICVWGIIANIANIVVLTRKNMISSTNIILTWMAVADLLTMLSYFPFSLHFYIMREPELVFPRTSVIHWARFLLFHINFTVLCHTIAIWLTIILALFRYLFICFPIQGMTLCTIKRAKVSILAACLSSIIICIPNFLSTEIKENVYGKRGWNATVNNWTCKERQCFDMVDRDEVVNKVNYWVQAILIKLIPCFVLTILTILLIAAMHDANQRRMKLKSQGKKDESERAREHNRTTAMLLAVVGLFLLTEVPQGILTLCSIFIDNFFNDIYWPLGDLLDIMALLNNSVNFVLYCSMSSAFRYTFTDIFCGCCPKRKGGWLKVKAVHETTNGTQV